MKLDTEHKKNFALLCSFIASLLFITYEPEVKQFYDRHTYSNRFTRISKSTDSAIPRKIWLSATKDLNKNLKFQENLHHIKEAYQEAWDIKSDEELKFEILDDESCVKSILALPQRIRPRHLMSHYLEHRNGLNHLNDFDLCSVATLYIHGGYFLTGSLEVIEPYTAPDDVTFVGARNEWGLFQHFFFGSTSAHPVLEEILIKYVQYHQKKEELDHLKSSNNVFGELWSLGYKEALSKMIDTENTSKVNVEHLKMKLLSEDRLETIAEKVKNGASVSSLPQLRSSNCNFIILDGTQVHSKVHFFTRFQGSGNYCPDPKESN